MNIYAYENWRAHGHIVKLHREDCTFCNQGRGLAGGTRKDNGRWIPLGQHETLAAAWRVAKATTGAPTIRNCKVCLPSV